jgi:hypothetical protein
LQWLNHDVTNYDFESKRRQNPRADTTQRRQNQSVFPPLVEPARRIAVKRSCGCFRVDKLLRNKLGLKHGGRWSREYMMWSSMLARCYNPNHLKYKNYGGRGIVVCDRWRFGEDGRHPFECFTVDIGRRPSPEFSLDRIDNDGDYRPGNVRWATDQQQRHNKRNYKNGVHRVDKGKAFRTRVRENGRIVFCIFKTFEDALAAPNRVMA